MSSQLISWFLATVMIVFVPRYLGAEGVGKLHLAESWWIMLGVLITFGMDTLLIKETARGVEETPDFFGTSIVLRVLFFSICIVMLSVVLHAIGFSQEKLYIMLLLGAAGLVWQLTNACQSILNGLELMEIPAISGIAGKALYTGFGVALLFRGYGVMALAMLTVITSAVTFLIQFVYLARRYGLEKLRPRFDLVTAETLLRGGLPYLLSAIFLTIYMQIDVVIISFLVGDRSVGLYSAADRLFGTMLFVPLVFVGALFPALSRLYVEDQQQLYRIVSKSFDAMLILGAPMGLGLLAIAGELVELLYGADFAGSGPVLAVMGIVMILTYQNMILGYTLISIDRQNVWTAVMAVAVVATVPLDMLLVPWCESTFGNGAIGGALAFVITEAGMVAAGIVLLPTGMLDRNNLTVALRVLLASTAMAVVVWTLRTHNIAIQIALAAGTYFALIGALGVISKADLEFARSLILQYLQRKKPVEISAAN